VDVFSPERIHGVSSLRWGAVGSIEVVPGQSHPGNISMVIEFIKELEEESLVLGP
jgi:hypothetical protein